MNSIVTERLIMTPIAIDDASEFLAHLCDIDRFLSLKAPKTIAEAQELVRGYLNEIAAGREVRFCVRSHGGDFVGRVGLYGIGTDDCEVQLWIRKDFQKSGYGYEISRAFMDWVNAHVDYDVIYAAFDFKNIASQALAKKLGGTPGLLEPKPIPQGNGKTLDIIWYEFRKPIL